MQQKQKRQNVEDAVHEMSKPLARYIDDTDLDRMLREQERDGDPMAKFLKKKNEEQSKKGKCPPKKMNCSNLQNHERYNVARSDWVHLVYRIWVQLLSVAYRKSY